MRKNIALVIAGILALGLGGYYWYWMNSPQYSLLQIKKSIEKHDLDSFNKYVDVESIVDRMIDQVLEKKLIDSKEPSSQFEQAGRNMAKGLVALMKPQMSKLVKDQIASYIEKGTVEEKKDQIRETSNSPEQFISPGLFQGKYSGVTYVKKDGKIALAGIGLYYDNYDDNIVLGVKMREKDGYWQLIEISNLQEFTKNLDSIKQKRIDQLNAPIYDAMLKVLTFSNISKKGTADSWGSRGRIYFTFKVCNIGSKDIESLKMNVICKNDNGDVIKTVPVDTEGVFKLKAGMEPTEMPLSFIINLFDENDKKLFQTPANLLLVNLQLIYIKFTDGSELKINENVPISSQNNNSTQITESAIKSVKSFQETLGMARKGDATAQAKLAEMYIYGQGVRPDETEVIQWSRKAAAQGNVRAQSIMGAGYLEGRGVFQDKQVGINLTRKAADQGDAIGMRNLGVLYLLGNGVPIDIQEGIKWTRKAAELGDKKAQFNYGKIYSMGMGVAVDKSEAAKWGLKAAEQDYAPAQYAVGYMYLKGEGVNQNKTEALKWLSKAAANLETHAIELLTKLEKEGKL